jgi:5-methylcytosine-specific restriction endonuclease McrA
LENALHDPLSAPPCLSIPIHRLVLSLITRETSRMAARKQASGVTRTVFARACSSCGVLLPANTSRRCPACTKPQRSGSSRPELDRSAWQKLRRAARLRDGNRCVRCGSTERLSVHHAVEGSNLLEDLVTLCSRCQGREHRRMRMMQRSRFLEPNRPSPKSRRKPGSYLGRGSNSTITRPIADQAAAPTEDGSGNCPRGRRYTSHSALSRLAGRWPHQ